MGVNAQNVWVNMSDANCSNTYSRLNNTQGGPFCSPSAPFNNDKMESGDVVILSDDVYNGQYDITGRVFTSNTTVKCNTARACTITNIIYIIITRRL